MADNLDSLENFLSCQVCFYEFREDGEHIPRLLPCTHTLCESCIGQLIRNDKLECPECRKMHEAEGIKSFPQNKYLLSQVKRKSPEYVITRAVELCEEHQFELILFCLEGPCQRAICISCLNEKHRRHDVTGIECGQREVLAKNASMIERNLRNKLAVLSAAKSDVKVKAEACKLDLKKRKEEIDKHFEKMAKEIDLKENEMKKSIDTQKEALNDNIQFLVSLKNTAEETSVVSTKETAATKFEMMMEMKENINSNLSGDRHFSSLNYEGGEPISALVGNFGEDHITIHLPVIKEPITSAFVVMRNLTDASQLKCKGTESSRLSEL